ncbi:MAG: dienelactone hydrolase family protein [Methylobacter sp.]
MGKEPNHPNLLTEKIMICSRSPTFVDVSISFKDHILTGLLTVPEHAKGLVVFAHGSGSSRFSRRNRFVAEILNEAGISTLLFDLLTAEEEDIDQRTREFRFNIGLLTERLIGVIDWVSGQTATAALPIGLFGASTNAAATLGAAAAHADKMAAVVSRSKQPDLALPHLVMIKAPTLLILGGEDKATLELNQKVAKQLPVEHRLEIIPGATHLFEEAKLICSWFLHHLSLHESRRAAAVYAE